MFFPARTRSSFRSYCHSFTPATPPEICQSEGRALERKWLDLEEEMLNDETASSVVSQGKSAGTQEETRERMESMRMVVRCNWEERAASHSSSA